MGLGGFLGKLGKGLLKVGKVAAPIALGMTGVGLPAAMAVSGGLNALDKKVSGGSWKGALGAGLTGAATGALSSGLGGFAGKLGGKLGAKAGGQFAQNAVDGVAKRALSPGASTLSKVLGHVGTGARIANDVGKLSSVFRGSGGTPNYTGRSMPRNTGGMNGSLASYIQRGRNTAIRNQPWRTPPFVEPPNEQMPDIYPNLGRGISPRYMPSY